MVLIKLMEHDYKFPINEVTPTTVVSFYTKHERCILSEAISSVKNRFEEILKVNPWMCGRLVKQNHEGETNVYLSFDEHISDADSYIAIVNDDNLFELTDWVPLTEYLYPLKPKKGSQCLNKNEKLCQLMIFHNFERSRLALMLSLNHCIGDGQTVYRLWKMLDKDEVIEPMVVERCHDMHELVEQTTNLQQVSGSDADDIKFCLRLLGRGLRRKICCRTPPRTFMYRVDSDEVKRQKSKYNSEDSFVSTTDILCTWLFSLDGASNGMSMLVNVRERIPVLHGNMAGNYVADCPVSFAEINTPKDFRNRWNDIVNKKRPADKVSKCGNASASWLYLYHQVEVRGCTHDIHLPVFSPCDYMEGVLGIPMALECHMVIFHLNKNEVGIVMATYNDFMTENYFDGCKLLDQRVSL